MRLKAVLVAEKERSFRFETLSPFGQPISVMTSDGERLWLLSEGRLQEGPALPEYIARLLPLPLRPEEIVDTLLGGVPVSSRFKPEKVTPDGDNYLLDLRGGGGNRARLIVAGDRKQIKGLKLYYGGQKADLEVSFESWLTPADKGPPMPERIRVLAPAQKMDVRIKLKEVETNVTLDPKLFRLEAPEGMKADSF